MMKIAHQGQDLQGALVDFVTAIGDDADDNLLLTVRAPHFGSRATAQMRDVLDHTDKKTIRNTE